LVHGEAPDQERPIRHEDASERKAASAQSRWTKVVVDGLIVNQPQRAKTFLLLWNT
jgi:hypothetical protein